MRCNYINNVPNTHVTLQQNTLYVITASAVSSDLVFIVDPEEEKRSMIYMYINRLKCWLTFDQLAHFLSVGSLLISWLTFDQLAHF